MTRKKSGAGLTGCQVRTGSVDPWKKMFILLRVREVQGAARPGVVMPTWPMW